ncbi:helicase [Planctomycetales bacterium]|nr:helicase [Planctomycetales bacterium]
MLTPNDILGENGSIARRLERYELRREQLDMSDAVHKAFSTSTHLAVEAGTGVGKSFAYLVPAILATAGIESGTETNSETISATDDVFDEEDSNEAPPRAVISTHTISLQEQLIDKDIPFLRSVLPLEFTAVLVKGRSNYLCLRRLATLIKRHSSLFEDSKQYEIERLSKWSEKTADGSKSDLNPQPDREVWNEVCCEQGNCLGKKCSFYNNCFYAKARRRISNAQLLVVNHALLFSDLAVRIQGGNILPVYKMLVFDESHTVEQVAADHLGISLTQGQIDYNLNRLYNDRTQKGLLMERSSLPYEAVLSALQAAEECRYRAETFFSSLNDYLNKRPGSNGRVREKNIVPAGLSESLRSLTDKLRNVIDKTEDNGERQELRAARDKIASLNNELDMWLTQGLEDEAVYYLERFAAGRGMPRIKLCASPLDIGPILRENLFDKVSSVVMTSATLAVSKTAPFKYFKTQIGMPAIPAALFGSPFDYEKQTTLVMINNAPQPDAPEHILRQFYESALRKYIAETGGGVFVLFTSYQLLKRTAADLTPYLAEENMPLFIQGGDMQRSEMLRHFKNEPNGVLFGTDSFWQGVDVPGNALRNVIITKLPFLVPSHPVIEAKIETIQKRGGNSFNEYQLPAAVLKFKQGFGRLIRTRTDSGLVVVLDPRIHTKSYGRQFLESLPKCTIRTDSAAFR